ncbi:MAG: prepilin-type N-terminal cleavage/methylation domain-containing protein [Bdellovibrionales bacterium]|nr:prepilin-type N-terminal cleavage/methylation domain-containing protein [Bdellovibrionales bacterium]
MKSLKISGPTNQKGFSLIEAMVAVAICGVVVSAMATVYVAMRDNLVRDQAFREAESLRAYVQGILNQSALCSGAMRSSGGPPSWVNPAAENSRSSDITDIQAVDTATGMGGTTVLSAGQNYSNNLRIVRMYLRKPINTPQHSEGIASTQPYQMDRGVAGVQAMTLVPAKLVIESQMRTAFPTSTATISRIVDVGVAVNDATNEVQFCFNNLRSLNPTSYSCNSTTVNPNYLCYFQPRCHYWYYIAAFDASGNADCRCATSCSEVSILEFKGTARASR